MFGYELPGEHRVNNAVLGLPSDSQILRQMIDFTDDRYSIAPFLSKNKIREMKRAKQDGKPVHITKQPWGVWGPMMVTHYVHELKLEKYVQPLNAFYPITFRERDKLLRTRKTSPRYQRALFKKAVSKGHTDLAKPLGEHILKQNPNRAVRLGMRAL